MEIRLTALGVIHTGHASKEEASIPEKICYFCSRNSVILGLTVQGNGKSGPENRFRAGSVGISERSVGFSL